MLVDPLEGRKGVRKGAKLELAGSAISDGTVFDWSEEILADFNSQSVPVLKRSCISKETNNFNSFRIVMRGSDPSKNILSNSAGPSEFGKCGNKRAPVEE